LPLLYTSSHLQAWPEWAAVQGLDAAGFSAGRRFDHLPLMLEAAVAKLGIAIAPELLVEGDLSRGRLRAPLGFVPHGAVFALCTLSQRKDAALDALRAWLKAESGDSAPADADA
jgi:DNA-binding transcriptional LysR family regulator